jgi:hypothetical protein
MELTVAVYRELASVLDEDIIPERWRGSNTRARIRLPPYPALVFCA